MYMQMDIYIDRQMDIYIYTQSFTSFGNVVQFLSFWNQSFSHFFSRDLIPNAFVQKGRLSFVRYLEFLDLIRCLICTFFVYLDIVHFWLLFARFWSANFQMFWNLRFFSIFCCSHVPCLSVLLVIGNLAPVFFCA